MGDGELVFPERNLCNELLGSLGAHLTGNAGSTYVVCTSVAENIIESLRLGYVFGVLADNDSELDFVVGEMFLDGLSYARNPNWCESRY